MQFLVTCKRHEIELSVENLVPDLAGLQVQFLVTCEGQECRAEC